MSPICKAFVQNAWRKDLCSNCFKSEEEHNSSKTDLDSGSRKDYSCNDGSNIGRRYVSVADRPGLYSRNYYGSKSWNPLMLDNSNNDSRVLKSPGLIKGMDSIIKQENEKNRNLSGINLNLNDIEEPLPKPAPDVITIVPNIPKDSWILSQIIGESTTIKTNERSERIHGESSSDLGSDASHDTSVSSGNTSVGSEGDLKGDASDASSIKSEPESAHEEEPAVHGILKTIQPGTLHRGLRGGIIFNEHDQVIGYGGDVDYSDDEEDDYDDDDDDDNSSVSSIELTVEDRKLKRLTEKNTNFNSENENLEKDYVPEESDDDSLNSYDFLSAAENERQNNSNNKNKTDKDDDLINRQDVKVKLKRSQPLAGIKPHIKLNFSTSYNVTVPNPYLDTQSGNNRETIPMQGIKPRFVSREEEMRENTEYEKIYETNKFTSIDDITPKFTSIDYIPPPPAVTSIDSITPKVTSVDSIIKKTSIDDVIAKITPIDDVISKVNTVDVTSKTTSRDATPKFTSIDEVISKIPPFDDIPKVSPVKDAPKVTSVDDIIKISLSKSSDHKTELREQVKSKVNYTSNCTSKIDKSEELSRKAATKNIPNKIKPVDNLPANPTTSNITKNIKVTNIDEYPEITYVDDMSAYESQSSNSTSNNQELNKTDSTHEQNSNKINDRINTVTKPTDGELDYSITSAQYLHNECKTNCKTKKNEKDDKQLLKDIRNSQENLNKLSAGVIPMNMITIQRRSSFMESQLGGAIFSIETLVTASEPVIKSNKEKFKAPMPPGMSAKKAFTEVQPTPKVTPQEKVPDIEGAKFIEPKTKKLANSLAENKREKEKSTEQEEIIFTKVNKVSELIKNKTNEDHYENDKENTNKYLELSCQPSELVLKESISILNDRSDEKIIDSVKSKPKVEKVIVDQKENFDSEEWTKDKSCKRKLSESNSLSTFGTPVSPSSVPNSSFLHSGSARPVTESGEINSIIFSSTPEFLKDIKSPSDQPSVTACIQKSSIYAPSSCLKGVPLGKPATTPKPMYLKDKPKVPIKPYISSSNIYNRELTINKKFEQELTSTVTSELPLRKSSSESTVTSVDDFGELNAYKNCGSRNSPPSVHAPKIPDSVKTPEVVYDVPVTVASSDVFSAPSPTSSSSGYSTTSNASQSENNTVTYQESTKNDFDESFEKSDSETVTGSSDTVKEEESHYRAKFEATRNILSESMSFESKPIPKKQNDQDEGNDLVKAAQEVAPERTETEKEDDEKLSLEPETETKINEDQDFQPHFEIPHSYVNLHPAYDNHDIDSYSSFTDDFDDDDDDDDYKPNKNEFLNIDNREKYPPLRRTERSSSATPLFRNSVGPITFSPTCSASASSSDNLFCPSVNSKPPAVRSRSVPRSTDNGIDASVFSKHKQESSYRFGFGKSGFFRPSSPPSMKRKASSERGRERSKKSHSVFSLRKLLRFGSGGDKSKGASKESEKTCQRETRKMKLQIIHPLDYNTNGVEVITRPEKRSPTYDFTGINDPLIQEALRQHALEMNEKMGAESASVGDLSHPQAKREETKSSKANGVGKVIKKNSFLKKKRNKPERTDSERSEVQAATSYVRQSHTKRNSREEESNLYSKSSSTNSIANLFGSQTAVNLGFNSEGRPRPPPPPRKTSLDANAHDGLPKGAMNPPPRHNSEPSYPNAAAAASGHSRAEGDTSSLSSTCSSTRPNRPPPPRRTPSNNGAPTHQQTFGIRPKDSVYANLGNARASFTPRKPGRSASIRDEEREKRRAPNPPPPPNQQHYQYKQQQQQQQQKPKQQQVPGGFKEDSKQSAPSDTYSHQLRAGKGPAPPAPSQCDFPPRTHDYEYISNSPEKKEKTDVARSSASSSPEKTSRQRGRRGSVVTNLSLEDQYGAVVFANLEALSNMLDQMCATSQEQRGGHERLRQQVTSCSHVTLSSKDAIACGLRLFYPGVAADCNVTVMVTPETKVEMDPLLMPNPILSFKDNIPASFLPSRKGTEQAFVSGSLWILPKMSICSPEEFSHGCLILFQERASEWERRICLFLLQIVSALKQLQAKGIEETSLTMILVITNMHGDDNPRLLMAASETNISKDSSDSTVTLCQCAAAATQLLLGHSRPMEAALKGPVLCPSFAPSPHAFSSLVTTLREERSSSLTKAKCILETMLFGPEDMNLSSQPDGELALQKWLDLERATVLHSLVREQASGSFNKNCIWTKFHLLFLVRTNVKALKDAIRVLEAPDVTNF